MTDHTHRQLATALTIDCDDCCMQGTAACADCVVTFLCDRDAGSPVVLDLVEQRAVRLLATAGMVPGLRHRAASG